MHVHACDGFVAAAVNDVQLATEHFFTVLDRRRRMGNRRDSQQKSGENDSFPEELSLSRLSGRPTISRYDLVRPVLSGEARPIFLW